MRVCVSASKELPAGWEEKGNLQQSETRGIHVTSKFKAHF